MYYFLKYTHFVSENRPILTKQPSCRSALQHLKSACVAAVGIVSDGVQISK